MRRSYEVLREDAQLPVGSAIGDVIKMDDYPRECALVELGVLKSLNEHVSG